ncbi:MAG: hypothetical protein WA057_05815 [Candidatus Magasanikiibacteriota bacterium]
MNKIKEILAKFWDIFTVYKQGRDRLEKEEYQIIKDAIEEAKINKIQKIREHINKL